VIKSGGWNFFFYSLRLGFGGKEPFRQARPATNRGSLPHKEALRRILTPINVSRCYEFTRTFELLRPEKGDVILDLSSPKLLSHYIAEKTGCRVIAADLSPDEVSSWLNLTRRRKSRPQWVLTDGRRLAFKDGSFDKAFSVSVLEHIPGEGDRAVVKELGRVLKPGGRLVLTVPYAGRYRAEFREKDPYGLQPGGGPYHWSHFYDEETIRERLLRGSGLELEGIFFGHGPGAVLWKKIERLGRFGFPLWMFSMPVAKFGLSEETTLPAGDDEDRFLAAIVVLNKNRGGS